MLNKSNSCGYRHPEVRGQRSLEVCFHVFSCHFQGSSVIQIKTLGFAENGIFLAHTQVLAGAIWTHICVCEIICKLVDHSAFNNATIKNAGRRVSAFYKEGEVTCIQRNNNNRNKRALWRLCCSDKGQLCILAAGVTSLRPKHCYLCSPPLVLHCNGKRRNHLR